MANFHAVDWAPLDHGAPSPVSVGDRVSAEAGGMPIYRVIAVEPGRAWVAVEPRAAARDMPLDLFRWRSAAPD